MRSRFGSLFAGVSNKLKVRIMKFRVQILKFRGLEVQALGVYLGIHSEVQSL
jgi:hypothetical protein